MTRTATWIILGLLINTSIFGQTKTEINNVIFSAGVFAEPNQSSKKIIAETDEVDGNTKCHVKTVKLVKRFDDYITFTDNSDLYPGAIVQ